MHRRDKLKCTWTFWQDQWGVDAGTGEKKQLLSHLGDGDNVKDFYVLLNRHGISSIPPNSSLHIFRKHVRPEWEDKHNIDGGHLRVFANILPGETPEITAKKLSCLWFDVLRSVIGEHFQFSEQVVGVGYTNKPHRPIMSVWMSTTDPSTTLAIRNEIFQLSSMGGSQLFTARFYSHKGLAKCGSGFKTESDSTSWHRRIQSAPETHVTVGDEEDEPVSSNSSARSAELQTTQPKEVADAKAVVASPKKPTAVSQPASPEKESPANLLARRGVVLSQASSFREHVRSRTETHAPEAITSQPIKPQLPLSESPGMDGDTAAVKVPSIAPTPIKDWTTDWSPSAFAAAQSQRSGNAQAARVAKASNPFSRVIPLAPGPPRAVGMSPEVGQVAAAAAIAGGSAPPAPPAPVAPSPSIAVKTPQAKPVIVDPNQLSDRKPFVSRGFVYPPRMNRKDYRAIIFSQGPNPVPFDGAFPAPETATDGEISVETFEAWKTEYLAKPLDVN